MNTVLSIIVDFILLAAVLVIFTITWRSRKPKRKSTLQLNPNVKFIEAVRLAILHGQVTADFLSRRMKITKKEAGEIVAQMEERGVVVMNENRIAELAE
jgi:hypothetical protein